MKIKKISNSYLSALLALAVFTACDDNTPEKEDVPELITKLTLTFSPVGGGSNVVVSATDPDGEGVQDIEVDGVISLDPGKAYTLSLTLLNTLADPNDEAYDITAEVEEEGAEHQFFFEWSEGVFTSPEGTGNIIGNGTVNYEDEDENGLPLGLSTSWTTVEEVSAGTFRIALKHQPDLKSASSGFEDGESDVDLTFDITIE